MPRPSLGARLWLNPSRKIWIIRDGQKTISTGCRGWKGAQEKFNQYMDAREPRDGIRTLSPVRGFIYFVTAEYPGFPIKIGFMHRHDDLRLKALQTGCPYPLMVLATLAGTYADERALHSRFKECRLQGEWFRRTDELMALIAEQAKEAA